MKIVAFDSGNHRCLVQGAGSGPRRFCVLGAQRRERSFSIRDQGTKRMPETYSESGFALWNQPRTMISEPVHTAKTCAIGCGPPAGSGVTTLSSPGGDDPKI